MHWVQIINVVENFHYEAILNLLGCKKIKIGIKI